MGTLRLAHLDMLPHIGFRVDDAHVRLIGASIDEDSIVHLEKGVTGIVLLVSDM